MVKCFSSSLYITVYSAENKFTQSPFTTKIIFTQPMNIMCLYTHNFVVLMLLMFLEILHTKLTHLFG